MSIRLSVYYCFNNFWRRKIISCVIRSPADYMAEWENVPLDPKKKKKQRVNLEPRRPMAARLKKKQRVNLEPRRPMAARLKKKQRVNLEPPRPMAARLKKKHRVNLEPPRPMAARLKRTPDVRLSRNQKLHPWIGFLRVLNRSRIKTLKINGLFLSCMGSQTLL